MSGIKPMNGWVFIKPIQETKETGGLELIAKFDEQDRYSKAEVVYVCDDIPLKCCDVVLYDKNNGHGYQHENELLTVLHVSNIIGAVNA